MIEEITDFHDIYVMDKVLGSGAFGIVWKIKGKFTGTHYALKMSDITEKGLKNAEVEMDVMKELAEGCGDYTPEYYDTFILLFQGVKYHCFLMEYIEGVDMLKFMEGASWGSKIHIPTGKFLYITKRLLRGLECIHEKNIVHRDIKPENIIITKNADPIFVDFGFSCFTSDAQVPILDKCSSLMKGTPRYTSPEEIDYLITNENIDILKKSDVWSLGVLLYKIANKGMYPFPGDTKEDVYENIRGNRKRDSSHPDEIVNNIINIMMTHDYKKRPSVSYILKKLNL